MLKGILPLSIFLCCSYAALLRRGRTAVFSANLCNIIVEDFVIARMWTVTTALECLTACVKEDKCQTIFFHKAGNYCQANSIAFLSDTRGKFVNESTGYAVTDAACPFSSGYLHNKATGICYKIHNKIKQTWTESRDICFEEGGDLIVLNTLDKYNYIVNTIRASPSLSAKFEGFHVGASNEDSLPLWHWVNGQALPEGSQMWASGKPDTNGTLRYVWINNNIKQGLDDTENDKAFYFICEKEI